MNKNIIIIIVAALMVLSSLAIGLDSATGQSPGGSNAIPSAGSSTAYIGDVVIYANGTVSNPSVISHSRDIYTLASNINGTVTDLMNNSVLNGNGYTINGIQRTALNVYNVTGITIENLIVVNSTYGISLTAVSNALLTNDTLIGSHSVNEYFVLTEFGTNVTIENSNFQFNHTATDSYGVVAFSDVLLNVSSNNFSGATSYYFIEIYTVSSFSAWNNRIMSTDQSSVGILIEEGASAVLGYNYFNYTDTGIYVYYQQSVTSLYNHVGNSTYGTYVEDTTTFLSSHDNLSHNKYAAYIEYTSYGLLQHDNLSSSTYGAGLEYNLKITIEDSNISNVTSLGVYSEEGSVLNLYNDQFNEGTSSSVYAVLVEYMSGGVNLAGDSIYVPNDYGVYLEYTPYFTVTNSYINATYNIYVDSSILGATVSNNSLITMNKGYTFYMYDYSYLYNLYFTNNAVSSSTTSHADYGIYTYVYYGSSNVVISGNRFLNNQYPIYLYMDYGGSTSVKVLNNVFINSTYAVEISYYSNVTVTGNTIINVSDEGIYLYSEYAGVVNVSYNTVENLPGFGSFSYGIDVEDFYSGNNYISHNTVLNGGSASDGIYLYEMLGTWVFDNHVNNTGYAYYFEYNNVMSFFNNTASNSDYGLYSYYYNSNFSYYSNTFINDNYSLYSEYDFLGYIYANTFLDTQSNAPAALHFLYLYYPYGGLTFYHNNFLNETTNSIVQNYYYNPDNYPVYMNAPLPTGGNYWSNYTGSGYNGIGTTPMPVNGSLMDYYPLISRWISPTVTFMETGLPAGTSWSVSMGSTMYSSAGGSIVFSPTNGQYMNVSYSVSHVSGYVASAASGTVYLNGMNKIVTVSFTPYTYAVTFTESNLPSGTTWSVTLNGNKISSITSTISFSLSNGTYNYTIGTITGYHSAEGTGTFQVNATSKSININFVQNMYTLVVSETGLPAGMAWTVNVSGTSKTTTSTSVDIQLVSGTYNVSVSTSSDYNITLSSGSVTINNANATVSVIFKNTTTPSKVTNSGAIYEGLGAGVVVGAVVGILGTMMYSGTWIFRKFRKGKGGTQ